MPKFNGERELKAQIFAMQKKYLPVMQDAYKRRERVVIEVQESDMGAMLLLMASTNIIFTVYPKGSQPDKVHRVSVDYSQVPVDVSADA